MEPLPRTAALAEEEFADDPEEKEEHDFYWEEVENLRTGEINMIRRRGYVPRGCNPRRNQVYSTGTGGRKNYPSNNLYQQYVPKTLTKSTGVGSGECKDRRERGERSGGIVGSGGEERGKAQLLSIWCFTPCLAVDFRMISNELLMLFGDEGHQFINRIM